MQGDLYQIDEFTGLLERVGNPGFNLHQSNAAMRRRLTFCTFERFISSRASSDWLTPHCSLGMSQRIELWTRYVPDHLYCSKQGHLLSNDTLLVDGSAPKPLITRAKLCGCGVFLRHPPVYEHAQNRKSPIPGVPIYTSYGHRAICYRVSRLFLCTVLGSGSSSRSRTWKLYRI